MRSLKITAAVLVAVVLVCVPSVATAAPLSVAQALPAAAPPNFDPSSSKWRAYMLNIVGSVLGNATPSKWRAEQIANEYAMRMSPDYLASVTGIGKGSSLDAIPETIEDYYAQEYDRQIKRGTVAKKPKKFQVPATAAKNLVKTVGGVATALTGLEIGTMLGAAGSNLLGGWMGFDANGVVCAAAADSGSFELTSWVTGQDCSAWDYPDGYVPNADAEGGTQIAYGGITVTAKGYIVPPTFTYQFVCGVRSGPLTTPTGYVFEMKGTSGTWVSFDHSPTTGTTHTSRCLRNPPNLNGINVPGSNWHGTNQIGAPLEMRVRKLSDSSIAAASVTLAADPTRTQDCTITYTDGTTDTASGAPYVESSGQLTPAACPPPDAGKVVDEVVITENGATGGPKELYREDTTEGYKDWQQQFPECGDGTCFLDLVKITPGAVVSCFDLTDGCPGWFEDPNKTDNYRCVYGSEAVGLAECAVYSGLFTPGRVEVGAPYSDPMTGTWTGGSNAPRYDQQAMGQTVQNPAATYRSCNGLNVTGFDPVGFVMRPIQCALEWAFVPRPLVVESAMTGAQGKWDTKPPAVIAEAVTALTPSAAGCSRPVTLFGSTFNIIDVCSGIGASIASWSRLVTGAAMVILVLVVLRRQIAAMVNYNQGQG